MLSKVKADSDLEPSPVPLRYLEVAYCSSKTLSRVINGFVAGIRELYFSFAESSSRLCTTPLTDCRRVEEFNLTCRHNDKDRVNRILEEILTSGANLRRLVSYSADERSVMLLRRFKNVQQLALVSYHTALFISHLWMLLVSIKLMNLTYICSAIKSSYVFEKISRNATLQRGQQNLVCMLSVLFCKS